MKKKLLIILVLISTMVVVGCSVQVEERNSSSSASSQNTNTVLLSDNGVDVKNIAVELVGSTFNFQVVFSNSNSVDRDFNLAKFDVKLGNKSLTIGGSKIKTIKANQTYQQWAFTMSDTGNLKVGDTVKVYYNDKFIKDVKVTEF